MADLVHAVKQHALDHYESDGWDFVVECWSDAQIAECIGKSRTEKGAIDKVKRAVAPLAEQREEVVRAGEW